MLSWRCQSHGCSFLSVGVSSVGGMEISGGSSVVGQERWATWPDPDPGLVPLDVLGAAGWTDPDCDPGFEGEDDDVPPGVWREIVLAGREAAEPPRELWVLTDRQLLAELGAVQQVRAPEE